MTTSSDSEIIVLAKKMAAYEQYEDAWTIGLELQAFGQDRVDAFKHVLKEGTPAARRATAFWLSDEAETIPAEIFLEISTDDDDDIRFYAAYGLGYVEHQKVIPQIRSMMLNDSSAEVRQTAAHSLYSAALLNNGIDEIVKDFAAALEKETATVVKEEIVTSLSYFLGTHVVEDAIKLLKKAADDTDETVSEQAQISLSILKNEEMVVQ